MKEGGEGNEKQGVVGQRGEEEDATGGAREYGTGSGGITRVVPVPTLTRTHLLGGAVRGGAAEDLPEVHLVLAQHDVGVLADGGEARGDDGVGDDRVHPLAHHAVDLCEKREESGGGKEKEMGRIKGRAWVRQLRPSRGWHGARGGADVWAR